MFEPKNDYNEAGLHRKDLVENPFIQFNIWFQDVVNEQTLSGTVKIPCDMDITAVPTFNIGWTSFSLYTY